MQNLMGKGESYVRERDKRERHKKDEKKEKGVGIKYKISRELEPRRTLSSATHDRRPVMAGYCFNIFSNYGSNYAN